MLSEARHAPGEEFSSAAGSSQFQRAIGGRPGKARTSIRALPERACGVRPGQGRLQLSQALARRITHGYR